MDKNRPVEFIFAIKVYLSLDGSTSVSEGTYVPCISRAVLALLSVLWFAREYGWRYATLSEKRTKPKWRTSWDSCWWWWWWWLLSQTKSNIEAAPVREFRALIFSLFSPLCLFLFIFLWHTYFASNYSVTSRRRERYGRASDLSQPAYCRDIFSPTANLASSRKNGGGDGGGEELLRVKYGFERELGEEERPGSSG